jgi:hypothetical protein
MQIPVSARRERLKLRLSSLIAYFLAALAFHRAESIALDAYNMACAEYRVLWPWPVVPIADVVKEIALITLVMSVPALLARSDLFIKTSLFMAGTVLFGAFLLLPSAGMPPPDCAPMDGWHSEHSPEFLFFLHATLVLSLSTIFLLVDLSIWSFRQLARFVG